MSTLQINWDVPDFAPVAPEAPKFVQFNPELHDVHLSSELLWDVLQDEAIDLYYGLEPLPANLQHLAGLDIDEFVEAYINAA